MMVYLGVGIKQCLKSKEGLFKCVLEALTLYEGEEE